MGVSVSPSTTRERSSSEKREKMAWTFLRVVSQLVCIFVTASFVVFPLGYFARANMRSWYLVPLFVPVPAVTWFTSLAFWVTMTIRRSPEKRGRDFWISASIFCGILLSIALIQVASWGIRVASVAEHPIETSTSLDASDLARFTGTSLAEYGSCLFRTECAHSIWYGYRYQSDYSKGIAVVGFAFSVIFSGLLYAGLIVASFRARAEDKKAAETTKEAKSKLMNAVLIVGAVFGLLLTGLAAISYESMDWYAWFSFRYSVGFFVLPLIAGAIGLVFGALAFVGAFRLSASRKSFWIAVSVFASLSGLAFLLEASMTAVTLRQSETAKFDELPFYSLTDMAAHGFMARDHHLSRLESDNYWSYDPKTVTLPAATPEQSLPLFIQDQGRGELTFNIDTNSDKDAFDELRSYSLRVTNEHPRPWNVDVYIIRPDGDRSYAGALGRWWSRGSRTFYLSASGKASGTWTVEMIHVKPSWRTRWWYDDSGKVTSASLTVTVKKKYETVCRSPPGSYSSSLCEVSASEADGKKGVMTGTLAGGLVFAVLGAVACFACIFFSVRQAMRAASPSSSLEGANAKGEADLEDEDRRAVPDVEAGAAEGETQTGVAPQSPAPVSSSERTEAAAAASN